MEHVSTDRSSRRDAARLRSSDGTPIPVFSPAPRRPTAAAVKVAIVVADLVTIAAAMGVAFHLRLLLPGHDASDAHSRHLILGALTLPIWFALFAHYRLYQANRVTGRREEIGRLVHAVAASVAAMALVGFMGKVYVARGWLVLLFLMAVTMLAAEREVVRRLLTAMHRRGLLLRRVLIVGANSDGLGLGATLLADPSLGYDVVGFVDDDPGAAYHFDHRPVLGSVDETLDVVRASGAQGVIVITTAVGMTAANRLARELPDAGIRLEVLSTLCDISIARLSLRSLGRFPVLHVDRVKRQGWRAVAKRTFDVIAAGTGLVVFSPVLLVAAVAIKVSSRGPVLFRQKRLGLEGTQFEILKLRTMVLDADQRLAELSA
ncbi:MAG TPA: sugar transferase, partial [Acidimicrobiia bacterium]|nr:sugar transferase [Acidimicrobiia bacterium]